MRFFNIYNGLPPKGIFNNKEVDKLIKELLSQNEVQSSLTLNDWARYVDKINKQDWVNHCNY